MRLPANRKHEPGRDRTPHGSVERHWGGSGHWKERSALHCFCVMYAGVSVTPAGKRMLPTPRGSRSFWRTRASLRWMTAPQAGRLQ